MLQIQSLILFSSLQQINSWGISLLSASIPKKLSRWQWNTLLSAYLWTPSQPHFSLTNLIPKGLLLIPRIAFHPKTPVVTPSIIQKNLLPGNQHTVATVPYVPERATQLKEQNTYSKKQGQILVPRIIIFQNRCLSPIKKAKYKTAKAISLHLRPITLPKQALSSTP